MSKFQELTRKEKIEHIWEYYKFHIIATAVGVFFVIQLLVLIFGPKPPKPLANVVIMGRYIHDDEKIDEFTNQIENIIDGGEIGKVELNMFPVDWSQSSQLTMAMEQKLMLMMQAKEIDVLIVEKEKFDAYTANNDYSGFVALDEIEELKEILESNKNNLIQNNHNENKVYGISTINNIKLQELGVGSNFIISIPMISENRDHAVKVIEWMYE